MLQCSCSIVEGDGYMATAKNLRRQAAKCAALAQQTQDSESRERYLRLEQMYVHLAETEERTSGGTIETAA